MDVNIKSSYVDKNYGKQFNGYVIFASKQGEWHYEKGRLTNITNATITVVFGAAFNSIPIGEVMVYRMFEQEPGVWVKQNVMCYYLEKDWLKKTGFVLCIDTRFESLTDVIMEWLYVE